VRRITIICLLLAAATAAVYGQVAGHEFVGYDDPDFVIANPYVCQGLTGQGFLWAFTTGRTG